MPVHSQENLELKKSLDAIRDEIDGWIMIQKVAELRNEEQQTKIMAPLNAKNPILQSTLPQDLVHAVAKMFHKTSDVESLLRENGNLQSQIDWITNELEFETGMIKDLRALCLLETSRLKQEEQFWSEQVEITNKLATEVQELEKMLEQPL
ncbi:unnamed protein product, partial [Mesorhabditis belari]|uniref:Uncharacterized protein n=1 Tax=Mesorhabditis belari TaxID=2138241 RepID=A0AAF3F2P4_9BILA